MADAKISALTSLTNAGLATDDIIPIVDTSATQTKQIAISELDLRYLNESQATAGMLTFLATPSSSNLLAAVTDETGTGALVFANTPTLVSPILGTPTSGTLTNCTLPVGGITGLGTGVGTFLATPSSANLLAAVTDETGTGALVFANTPTLVSPILGTPTSGNLANCTFPTLNQNTSGSAATLTNPRTIGGVSFDGSVNITVASATNSFAVTGTLTATQTGASLQEIFDIRNAQAAAAGVGTRMNFAGSAGIRAAGIAAAWDGAATTDAYMSFYTRGSNNADAERLRLTSDGRLYGSALHNNAGAVTGPTNQYIASGTYTPTFTNTSNIDGSTPAVFNWMRVGNVVTVSGRFDMDATTTLTQTVLRISLPIASATTIATQGGGVATDGSGAGTASCYAEATTDTIQVLWLAIVTTSNQSYTINYTYLVL